MVKWNDTLVNALRAYHAEGLTFTQISKALHKAGLVDQELSRSSIAGQCKRLGLFRGSAPVQIRKPKKTDPIKKTPVVARLSGGAVEAVLSLNLYSCRFPIGDPREEGFHFCSGKKNASQSYCSHHQDIVYNRSAIR